jgi:hypothetical protein
MLKWSAVSVLALLAVLAAAAIVGALQWRAQTRALVQRLDAARTRPEPQRYDPAELEGLPPPVQRYFRVALRPDAPIVAAVRVEHRGEFNMGQLSAAWKRLRSSQWVVTSRPGFVWDARVAIAPGLAVHVHDAFVAGEGLLRASVAGLATVADQHGTGAIAAGELMRYLAEAAWYPTALLPSQGVRWEPVDAGTARATIADQGQSVALTFRFGDDGLIASVRAEERGRTVEGRIVPTPWEGRWTRYEERDGMRIPVEGEVAWLTPEGRLPYWRAAITAVRYDFAP